MFCEKLKILKKWYQYTVKQWHFKWKKHFLNIYYKITKK